MSKEKTTRKTLAGLECSSGERVRPESDGNSALKPSSDNVSSSSRLIPDRRKFIKKAGLLAAGAGIGGLVLDSKEILPESSASSDGTIVTTCIIPCAGNLAVWNGQSSLSQGTNSYTVFGAFLCGTIETNSVCCVVPLGAVLSVRNFETTVSSAPVGIAGLTQNLGPNCWPGQTAGVVGSADTGVGVAGSSKYGFGVYAASAGSGGTPIVAQGASGQTGNLQEWISPCYPGNKSVVGPGGEFGIGTITPKALLDVNGTIFGKNVGVATGATPATSLGVNGSISAKVVVVKSDYPMGASDFAVFAKAAVTVTLPAASIAAGMIVFIKKLDPTEDGAVTVKASGSDLIEGSSSIGLPNQFNSLTLVSNGGSPGSWFILANAT